MSELTQWAIRHGVSQEALQELVSMSLPSSTTSPADLTSEANVQINARLEASKAGAALWRNNTGVAYDERGIPVRFGLCNESPQMNKRVKSADLIGIRPVTVTADMVGGIIGQFVAIECKHPGWTYRGQGREVAQNNFLSIVNSLGGYGKFLAGKGVFE